jgi:hypothetical protein
MQFILSILNHALQYRRLVLRFLTLSHTSFELVNFDADTHSSHQYKEHSALISQLEEVCLAMRERMQQFSQSSKLIFLVLKKLENSGSIGTLLFVVAAIVILPYHPTQRLVVSTAIRKPKGANNFVGL